MTKTNTIKVARATVSRPIGARTSWIVFGPYRRDQPHGARTEHHASSYAQAVAVRTLWVAEIALAWLEVDADVSTPDDGTTVEQLVSAGLRKARLTRA